MALFDGVERSGGGRGGQVLMCENLKIEKLVLGRSNNNNCGGGVPLLLDMKHENRNDSVILTLTAPSLTLT